MQASVSDHRSSLSASLGSNTGTRRASSIATDHLEEVVLGSYEDQPEPQGWDEIEDEAPAAPPPPYVASKRVIGIQFKPVPPDRDVLWDA